MLKDSDNARRKKFLNDFLLDDRLKKEGKSVPISLFIIDYELYHDEKSITGIEVCDNIEDIKEGRIPVILLTILTDGAIDNEKTRFVTKSKKGNKEKGGAKIEKLSKTLNRGDDGFVRTWNEDHREIDEILKDMRIYSEIRDTLNSTIDRLCIDRNTEIEDLCIKILQKTIELQENFSSTIESIKENHHQYKPELIDILREISKNISLLPNRRKENKYLVEINKLKLK